MCGFDTDPKDIADDQTCIDRILRIVLFQSAETGSVQIVYVVLVGGRAVPAAVAARDMRLVRDAEVAKELGAVVTTKAEREWKRGIVNSCLILEVFQS